MTIGRLRVVEMAVVVVVPATLSVWIFCEQPADKALVYAESIII